MSEIINLNRARKARSRTSDKTVATENRARFGRSKAEKAADRAALARTMRNLDQSRREP